MTAFGCRPNTPSPTALPPPATQPGSAAQAAPAAGTSPATMPPGRKFEHEGVRVVLPEGLARDVVAETFEAVATGPEAAPGGVRFVLQGYAVTERAEPAEIRVYHGPLSPDAPASSRDVYQSLFRLMNDQDPAPASIPILPHTDGRRLVQTRIQYLGTSGAKGGGVRFLTVIGSEPRPVSSAELWYVFQGISLAQGAWISVRAPIAIDDPLFTAELDGPTPAAFAAGLTPYLAEAQARLIALPASAFQPDLSLLDALAKSVAVDWPAPSKEEISGAEGGAATPAATAATAP